MGEKKNKALKKMISSLIRKMSHQQKCIIYLFNVIYNFCKKNRQTLIEKKRKERLQKITSI